VSVRARPEPAPIEDTPTQGLTLTPQQVAELRQLIREMRELLKEVPA